MKRRLLKLAGFLLLGAIVNIGVAWGCATLVEPTLPMLIVYTRHDGGIRSEGIQRSIGHVRLNWFEVEPSQADVFQGVLATLRTLHAAELVRDEFGSRDFSGWPCLSLQCWTDDILLLDGMSTWVYLTRQRERVIDIQGGIGLEPWTHVPPIPFQRVSVWRALPLHPIWPGFAINTLFYAAILWLLFAAPFALRRRLRLKRGLCPACAYPIGASAVCTECGAPLIKQKTQTQKAEIA